MSAFLMSSKSLAGIAAALVADIYENAQYYPKRFVDFKAELDKLPQQDRVRFAYNRLYTLNLKSIKARYGESGGKVEPMPQGVEAFKGMTLYKSIRCWMYQSNEDEETYHGQFYADMDAYSGAIAGGIVMKLPQWQEAAWG